MKKIVVLTGAGMSAESGLKTFRDSNGLWENHDVQEVASPEGWAKDMELVLRFYNLRRAQLLNVKPNEGHRALVQLEDKYDVTIVTQNVDDLHERAGSTKVIHLHGELFKVRSTGDENLVYEWKKDLNAGDVCEKGYQLRPHIVWFGETLPFLEVGIQEVIGADIIFIIGTSMQVYPAAALVWYKTPEAKVFFIDPRPTVGSDFVTNLEIIAENTTVGVPALVERLLNEAK